MALLKVLQAPHPCLREVAKPVESFDDQLLKFVDDLAETMYTEKGIGLAAPQVEYSRRLFVIDVDDGYNLLVFVNPTLRFESTELREGREGCLSVKNKSGWVKRHPTVTVTAFDARGTEFTLKADGMLAVAIQHEFDHLLGILFTDRLTGVKGP